MRYGRRARPSPLLPVNEPRWLVVRDQLSRAVACEPLQPLTDLRAALERERAQRHLEGWSVDEISSAGAFFFCSRGNERCCVGIENFAPGTAPIR